MVLRMYFKNKWKQLLDFLNNTIDFFIGNEVEHTPAFGMRTLFVTGIHNEQVIEHLLGDENSSP
jgi:hypothetical protein